MSIHQRGMSLIEEDFSDFSDPIVDSDDSDAPTPTRNTPPRRRQPKIRRKRVSFSKKAALIGRRRSSKGRKPTPEMIREEVEKKHESLENFNYVNLHRRTQSNTSTDSLSSKVPLLRSLSEGDSEIVKRQKLEASSPVKEEGDQFENEREVDSDQALERLFSPGLRSIDGKRDGKKRRKSFMVVPTLSFCEAEFAGLTDNL